MLMKTRASKTKTNRRALFLRLWNTASPILITHGERTPDGSTKRLIPQAPQVVESFLHPPPPGGTVTKLNLCPYLVLMHKGHFRCCVMVPAP